MPKIQPEGDYPANAELCISPPDFVATRNEMKDPAHLLNLKKSAFLFICREILLSLLVLAPLISQSQAPHITMNPASQVGFTGTNLELHVAATGTVPLLCQWYRNNALMPGMTNFSALLTNVTTAQSGDYFAIVSNASGSATSSLASVTILASRLWSMGENSSGQLGDSTLLDRSTPVSSCGGAIAIAAGSTHSLFIAPDGTLWAMGNNACGQLGNGTMTQSIKPTLVTSNVISVAACANQSLFIKADASLWAMGYNGNGQLGIDFADEILSPAKIATNVTSAAAGVNHTLFVTTNGLLHAMGENSDGQLGDGTTTRHSQPTVVASNVVFVSAGAFHSLFVQADGSLWGMGNNSCGQLGNSSVYRYVQPVKIATNVLRAVCGAYHSTFLKSDGTLWTMGDNSCGQLGNGTFVQQSKPGKIASGITQIASGFFHTLFIDTNSTLWAAGDNTYGQLGDGSCQNQIWPISIAKNVKGITAGSSHTLYTANWLQTFKIKEQPTSQSVVEDQPVTFTVEAAAEPEFTNRYQWRKNGGNIAGANKSSYTIAGAQLSDAGSYSVTVTLGGVTLISDDAQLVVLTAGSPKVWSEGQEMVGRVTLHGPTEIYFTTTIPDAYIFFTTDGTAPTYNSSIYDRPFTITNSAILRAAALSLDFTQYAESPPVTIDLLSCTLDAYTSGGGNVNVEPRAIYYAQNAQVTLTAEPDLGWEFVRWNGSFTGTNNPLHVSLNGSKTVEAIFGSSIQTNIVGQGTIHLSASGIVPYGTLVTATAVPTPGNVFNVWGNQISGWNNPTTFRFTTANMMIGALFSAATAGKTTITQNPVSLSGSQGSSVILHVTATGSQLTYQWRFNGLPIAGATNASLTISSLDVEKVGQYDVVVTGASGSATSLPAYASLTGFGMRPVITIEGIPGMPYRVEYCEDLTANIWKTLETSILKSSVTDVIDFSATQNSKRFYRVILDP